MFIAKLQVFRNGNSELSAFADLNVWDDGYYVQNSNQDFLGFLDLTLCKRKKTSWDPRLDAWQWPGSMLNQNWYFQNISPFFLHINAGPGTGKTSHVDSPIFA